MDSDTYACYWTSYKFVNQIQIEIKIKQNVI